MTDEINECGIFLLDVFMLDYCGIKVFLQVCGTARETVRLVELATKETKEGIMLSKGLSASKSPLIVRERNTHTKSEYEVKPINLSGREWWLPIEIRCGDPIWVAALEYEEFPPCGTAYAVPVDEFLDVYWEKPKARKSAERVSLA